MKVIYIQILKLMCLDDSHEVNEVFLLVDIPDQQWYYVILKTEDTKFIEEIKVLKVTEPVK